jgi:hypothetical protein
VAAEVRALASRSAGAAKEIKVLIQDSVNRVAEGTKLVDQSGQTLTEIVTAVKKVTDIVSEIAAASREQATGIEAVNKAISSMDVMTQQNAALVEQATAAAESLVEQARQLDSRIAQYKLREESVKGWVGAERRQNEVWLAGDADAAGRRAAEQALRDRQAAAAAVPTAAGATRRLASARR